MSEFKDPRDAEAPLPYVRSKSNYKPETIKFTYDAPTTYTKTVKLEDGTLDPKTQQPIVQTTTETVLTTKEKKITLKQYAHSRKEDAEHFFICLISEGNTVKNHICFNRV